MLIFCIISLGIIVFRLVGSRQIDGVNPYMYCSEVELSKVDVFYVAPLYKGVPINESRAWCDYILSFDKEIYMYGVKGSYEELSKNIAREEVSYGMDIFESCFGFRPERIKPPQLVLNDYNEKMLGEVDLNVDIFYNQLFHKVYHCGDSGFFPNRFQDYF